MEIRRFVDIRDEIQRLGNNKLSKPIVLALSCAVLLNPYAGKSVSDLTLLSTQYSRELANLLIERASTLLGAQPVAFAKGSLVGSLGESEHGSAIIHTRTFGDVMRALAGDSKAPITSVEKLAAPGATFDASFRGVTDTGELGGITIENTFSWTFAIDNCPKSDEIAIFIALSDGGRPNWRSH